MAVKELSFDTDARKALLARRRETRRCSQEHPWSPRP